MAPSDYRKHNDRSQSSRTYHKKDGTPIRAILKENARKEVVDACARWEEENASWVHGESVYA